MTSILDNLRDFAQRIEAMATDAPAALGPWLAPIPSAALVARASVVPSGDYTAILGQSAGGPVVLDLPEGERAILIGARREQARRARSEALSCNSPTSAALYWT